MKVTEIIKLRLKEKGISITSLAENLGKSRQHVYNLLTNRTTMYLDTLKDIADIIGVDGSEFFPGNEEEGRYIRVKQAKNKIGVFDVVTREFMIGAPENKEDKIDNNVNESIYIHKGTYNELVNQLKIKDIQIKFLQNQITLLQKQALSTKI